MSPQPLEIVVLAAGKGTRMRSSRAKVLHALAGQPLIHHVLVTAESLGPRAIHVVVGHEAASVVAAIGGRAMTVTQDPPRGTGHAVGLALAQISDDAIVLVLYGDVPLVTAHSLAPLVAAADQGDLALLTTIREHPDGYGRILRRDGAIVGIVEERDATAEQRAIREVNTGLLAAPALLLRRWIDRLHADNDQGEYYLTDIVGEAHAQGVRVCAHPPVAADEVLGINTLAELALAERAFQRRQVDSLLASGVQFMDPARFDLRGRLVCGKDVWIDVNVIIEGEVTLEDGVRIGASSVLRNTRVGYGARIEPHSIVDGAEIGAEAVVGPFARLRPGSRTGARTHIGNFVEIKQSVVGDDSKINHLSYVGDSTIGARVNIGAGVITCNYDGANKHRTTIGDDAFVGSDCQLVAPVTVGAGATVGAGSTITADVPPGGLTLSRAPQKSIPGWRRPAKKA
ncbi:MAG: bifunctional UDP-N-acetylglucosamine diphosphorylase/glucosamine-1-phosphate N-acetyltransferase GlmU [Acidiferrobacteraceae bacterium]